MDKIRDIGNDKRLWIQLTKENAVNLGRFCYMIGQHSDNCDTSIRKILEEYLINTLIPDDLKKIEKIKNTELKEKAMFEKEEEKISRPVWDKSKL